MKIGYMRVSTEDQSHDLQENALKAAGCDVIYSDTISGTTTSREGLDEALAALGEGDTLVVWKLDRLGRKATYLFDLVEGFGKRGIGFQSITESFDTTTPMGNAMFQMMGVFAELERNTISERTKEGLKAAKARGVRLGAKGMPQKQKDAIIKMRMDGIKLKVIANEFGIGTSTVSRVARGT